VTTLRSGSASDVGKVRTSNQDVAFESPDLFAVADGMGGHVGGEVAARVAVDALRAAFQRQPSVEGLRRAVAEANRAVWRQSQAESGLRGMGTTLTATALVQEADGLQIAALANVGDSRAYVFSKGQVIQVTADHSLAEEKVRRGQLTEAEAAVHPHRHILTRALGVSSDVDVDLWELHLRDGDRILLCSDGLTNEVGDEEIGEILGSVEGPEEAAKALVQAALDHGGSDNVTCVVIDVAGTAPPAASAAEGVARREGPTRSGSLGSTGYSGQEQPEVTSAEVTSAAGTSAIVRSAGAANGSGVHEDTSGARGLTKRTLRVVSGIGRHPEASSGEGSAGAAAGSGASSSEMEDGANGSAQRPPAAPGQPPASPSPLPGGALSASRLQAAELRRLQPTRHDRRRRRRRPAGAPRVITVRVVLFVIVLLGVAAAAYAAMRWYAMDEWYVGVDHGHLAVYQGRPGGFLWFHPQLVDETPVTTHEVLRYEIPHDRAEPSLAVAKRYVENLHAEYSATRGAGSASSAPSSAPSSSSSTGSAPVTGAGGTTSTTAGAFGPTMVAWQ
jgi:protein phosphatase